MAIWGKILGGTIGFGIGGPIGAILGAVAGHGVDKMSKSSRHIEMDALPYGVVKDLKTQWSASIIILAAKLSKVDGTVTRDEIAAIKAVFPIDKKSETVIGLIFKEALADNEGVEIYAEQIRSFYYGDPEMLKTLLGGLILIATSDGYYHPKEQQFIAKVSYCFGMSEMELRHVEAIYTSEEFLKSIKGVNYDGNSKHYKVPEYIKHPDLRSYAILGIDPEASNQEVKSAYRKIMVDSHPDKAIAKGMPEEFVELCNRKIAKTNAAYDKIKLERGLN